jgi:hypothetical protein
VQVPLSSKSPSRKVRPVAVLALPGAPGVVCFCTGPTSQVHLGFLKCALRPCRCAHGHTCAPLKPRGALCINKGALCISTSARTCKPARQFINIYSPPAYLFKKAGVRWCIWSCCSDRNKNAHSHSCALFLTGVVAGGASTRRSRLPPAPAASGVSTGFGGGGKGLEPPAG